MIPHVVGRSAIVAGSNGSVYALQAVWEALGEVWLETAANAFGPTLKALPSPLLIRAAGDAAR